MTPLAACLLVSCLLFTCGLGAVLVRRDAIVVLIGIELMLNAANLNFIAFWRFGPAPEQLDGPLFALFAIAIAAAEAAVGLALIIALFRHRRTSDINEADELQG